MGWIANPNAPGILVGSVFGLAWWIAGTAGVRRGKPVLAAVGVLIALALAAFAAAVPLRPASKHIFDGALYGTTVIAETVAILVAIMWLRSHRRLSLIPPIVAIVVGFHFVGLWLASANLIFVLDAIGLVGVGSFSLWNEPGSADRLAVTGFGSAAVLWASCAIAIVGSV